MHPRKFWAELLIIFQFQRTLRLTALTEMPRYVRGHEGRGIGLEKKLDAYKLQETQDLDTVDANLALDVPVEARSYAECAQVRADAEGGGGMEDNQHNQKFYVYVPLITELQHPPPRLGCFREIRIGVALPEEIGLRSPIGPRCRVELHCSSDHAACDALNRQSSLLQCRSNCWCIHM